MRGTPKSDYELLQDEMRQIKRENAALNHKLDEILTNKNYEGGVQFWINKHDEVLLREASLRAENAALRAAIKRIHKEWGRLVHAEDNLDDAIWKALAAAEKEAQP